MEPLAASYNAIRKKIDGIINLVSEKVANQEYAELESLLSLRAQLVAELIMNHSSDATLKEYLNVIRMHDREITQNLQATRDALKGSLLKVDKVKAYFDVRGP